MQAIQNHNSRNFINFIKTLLISISSTQICRRMNEQMDILKLKNKEYNENIAVLAAKILTSTLLYCEKMQLNEFSTERWKH